MAIADPKKYAVTTKVDEEDEPVDLATQVAALQETVKALLARQSSGGGLTEETLERILSKVATTQAEAMERAANPSNKTHPGISVYSYPEGDRARPRSLKCPMTWVGYPVSVDTTTAEEIELLNLAEPGVFSFQRSDKSLDKLTIDGERDAGGTITNLHFRFLVSERRETLPSVPDLLRSAFKVKSPMELELEELRAKVEAMKAKVPA